MVNNRVNLVSVMISSIANLRRDLGFQDARPGEGGLPLKVPSTFWSANQCVG